MTKYPIYSVENFICADPNTPFYANTFTEHLKSHSFIEKPHRHDSYLLLLFSHGSGTHEIDFDQFDIKPGSVFMLQPGQMHHWNLSTDIEGFVFIFTQAYYDLHFRHKKINDFPFFQSINNRPDIFVTPENYSKIIPLCQQIIDENQKQLPYHTDKVLNALDGILIEIARLYITTYTYQTHTYNLKLHAFEILVGTFYTTEKSPSFYAEKLNISLKHLNRICNEMLEKTATEVIMDRVILEIKRMLMDRNLAINEIADNLGYEDYSYFTRLFRKKTGLTPTNFRTKMLDENH